MSACAGWAHPAPVVHYLFQNLKKGNQARPDSPAACHPPKDDVTEWKQGHDLNMSERVEEEFNSIYRSNGVVRPFSLMLTSGKTESVTFSDWKYMLFLFFFFLSVSSAWRSRKDFLLFMYHCIFPPLSSAGPEVLGARLIMISVLGGAPKNRKSARGRNGA